MANKIINVRESIEEDGRFQPKSGVVNDEVFKQILEELKNDKLKHLTLTYNLFTPENAELLAKAVKESSLETIRLPSVRFKSNGPDIGAFFLVLTDTEGMKLVTSALADMVCYSPPSLQYIDMSQVHLDVGLGPLKERMNLSDEVVELLGKTIENNASLKGINLPYLQDIGTKACKGLANLVQNNKGLEYLSFYANFIGPQEDINLLTTALEKNETLRHFKLHNATFNDTTMDRLAAMLKKNTSLVKLQLINMKLHRCVEGMAPLFDAIKDNRTLHKVTVSGQHVLTDKEVEALKDMLKNNRFLCEFVILDVVLTSNQLKVLVKALEENNTLTFCSLGQTMFFDTRQSAKIDAYCERNRINKITTADHDKLEIKHAANDETGDPCESHAEPRSPAARAM